MPSTSRLLGLLLVTVALSIGPPLVGIGSFHAADMMGTMPPWSEQTPYDFRPDNAHVSDTVNAVVPMRASFRNRVWEGDLPLWDPLRGAGEPLAVVPNVGTFSPLTLPYLIAPLWLAPMLTKLIEFVVAAVGTYLLVRRWGLSRDAGLVGALAFVNSAFLVVWTNWPQSHVGALVPFVFWAVERAVTSRRHWDVWPLAPVVAVMWLEGFPAVTAYTLVTAGAYAVVRVHKVWGVTVVAAARLAALAGAVLLSLGLAAIQLLPFLRFLQGLGLDYRAGVAGRPLPWEQLATVAVPDVLGNPVERVYFGATNYVEGQSWVGVVVLVLLVALVVGRRRLQLPPGVLAFLGTAGVVGVVLVYFDTPLLAAWGELPLLGSNFIGRFRAVLGLLAAAGAAAGYAALVETDDEERDWRSTAAGLGVLAVVLGTLGWVAASRAAEAGQLVYAVMQAAVPVAVGGLAAALVLGRHAARAWRPAAVLAVGFLGLTAFPLLGLVAIRLGIGSERVASALSTTLFGLVLAVAGVLVIGFLAGRVRHSGPRALVALGLPVLLAVEAVAFAHPWWARTPTDLFYPPTATHDFLADQLGGSRFAAAGSTLYSGTNAVYGFRSVTAHAFQPTTYREYLRAIEPEAFARSTTFPFLSAMDETATSPLLDRAAARYWATGPLDPIHGVTSAVVTGDEPLSLTSDVVASAPLQAGRLRGVTLTMLAVDDLAGRPAVAVELVAEDGRILAAGSTRLHWWVRPGPVPVAVAETDVPAGSTVRVRLEGAERGGVRLAADDGVVALEQTVATDDGLRLVHTDGTVLYERTRALPRIRWAGRAAVVPTADARLAVLADGPDADLVVLSEGLDDADPSAGDVVVREDSGDVIVLDVVADGDGHVVVADGLQTGWHATLDGAAVPVVGADHAFGAVRVPGGEHEVRLVYDPDGWDEGRALTALSLLVLVLLVIGRQRATRGSRDRAHEESTLKG